MTEGITFAPSPILYAVIGLIVGLIIGWIIGFFDSNNRAAKKITAAEKSAEIKIREAEEKSRKAEEQISLASHTAAQDDPGLLRLKSDTGRYTLEMDGAPVTGVLPADKKKRLIDLLTVIRPYLEGGQPQPPAPKPAEPPQPLSPAQTPPVSGMAARTASPPVSVEPVKPTLGTIFSPAQKTVEEKSFASLSIVGQIDSILQSRLMNTPLAGRGIRLQESLQGAVEVYVGLQKFPSVDDVPDETIKAAIRAAIAEWEEKFTPGL
jgi:hypothetical protein